jgi:hypothetical protein
LLVVCLTLDFVEVNAFPLTPLLQQLEHLLELVPDVLERTATGALIFMFAKIFE